jgi:hypothetical protein
VNITKLFLLLVFVGYTFAAGASEFRIAGTVTKKGGGPLPGATVLLKSKNVSVVTAADGKFLLTPPVAVLMDVPQARTLSFTLRGNAVAFSHNAGKLNGTVRVLSGNGKCIASVDFNGLNPATDRIALPRLVPGLNIISATVNGSVFTCRVLQVGNELHLAGNPAGSTIDGDVTLARGAAAVLDTIVASKAGYEKVVMPIQSYTLSDVSLQMDTASGSGAIAWGKVENPTADCKVGTLPEYGELKSNLKLPNPFVKLDGTLIKDKSEWACRRQEILLQMYKYILGEKPVPAKGSVSGTVTTTQISVKVTEGSKSCSFTASVSMNGATQPAPALISYGAGATAPTGVAKITFTAIEGGSGAKTGPFFTFYGSNHPAGYMVAQAWQISRIIDVIEQNPGIIDPTKIALTGCSRNGKGAFFGGVLDNRVALTIPVESGMGGTVGLRLKEQLDPGDNSTAEWPYHAISYVRWLSEVALGKFTTGNNAASDNTDRLPVDMHSAMALIAPRAIYIVDNPGITNLDPKSAWVTGCAGKAIFEALGVGDNFAYEGASGSHCQWRTQYTASLNAMIDRFLKGNTATKTGTVNTDLSSKPAATQYYDWSALSLTGTLQ